METLYQNTKPWLRLLMRPREASTLEELIQRVQEIEEVQAQMPREAQTETRAVEKPAGQLTPSSSICKGGMLLEVWTAGTQSVQLPQSTQDVLFLVRQGQYPDLGLQVPEIGKRKQTGPTQPAARSERPAVPTQGCSSK